jgi:hypothetical protein
MKWPSLAEPYAAALRSALARIFEITTPDGVLVGGSVVQGKGDRTSDLDLYVVHAEPWRQRLQLRFDGVPCEIFVNPPAAIEGYLRTEAGERRPITAHLLATGEIVFDPRGVMARWRERGREALRSVPELGEAGRTSMRYFAACVFEDACDRIDEDPATAVMFLGEAVERMLAFALARAGRWMPRRKELLGVVEGFDPELARLARAFLLEGAPARKLELAGEVADRTIEARGFFEWEAERDPVDP